MHAHPSTSPTLLLVGGSGFLGRALGARFASQGWTIRIVARSPQPFGITFPCRQFLWNGWEIPTAALEGASAVINLAGQAIADQRWTPAYRELILQSRVQSSRALVKAIRSAETKPTVLIQASAVGFYGARPDALRCTEYTSAGTGFLAHTAQTWEDAISPLIGTTRLCLMRLGLVLGRDGGVLPKLVRIYNRGFGAVLGDGKQWMNFIHLEDVLRFCTAAVADAEYHGIYNLVAPHNCRNREFHELMCRYTLSLRGMQVPRFALRLFLGQRSDLLLHSCQVAPQRLLEEGFVFQYENSLQALLALFNAEATQQNSVP